MNSSSHKSKILLIENSSADFLKARIPLYHYLQQQGMDVYALVPNDGFIAQIRLQNVTVIEYELNRKDKGFIQILKLIFLYAKIINQHQFDIVHSFRFQPNLINALSNFFNRKKVILHITGLGIAFSNRSFRYLILRFISQLLFQLKLTRAQKVIIQNADDAKDIWFSSFWKNKLILIPGSGVNTETFNRTQFNKLQLRKAQNITEEIVFTCVTRLLWEKGIVELIDAFKELANQHKNIRLWIVGWSDTDNPRHVSQKYIDSFTSDETVTFMGRQNDVANILAVSDVFIYPSYYREGIPRGILEALAMGLPIITTKMPGCDVTVLNEENGFLIAPRSKDAIKIAVTTMLEKNNYEQMGKVSRMLAENKFSESIVFAQIAELYNT